MFCPPAEPVHAYLVPTLGWSKLQRGSYIYIHESCIKAIAGAKLGYWSIGLNGVRGWSSQKHGIGLVDELRALPWKALELNPVVVFDSNAVDNWDVQHAIGSLAAKLFELTGRTARHILLPKSPDDTHWGFDDFVVRMGEDEAKRFLDTAVSAEPVAISDIELLKIKLNEEVVVVRSLGRIAEQETGTLMSRGTFCDVNFADYIAWDEEKPVNVPKLWLSDPRRREVERLEYKPGAEMLSEGVFLNLWRGMGLAPVRGDVSRWLAILEWYITDEQIRKWVIQWFAYPLQNVGGKLDTFLHLYGPPGSGKQAILLPLMMIYGRNAVVIGRERIASDFNSIYATKQFVNLDEMHGGGERDAISIGNKIDMLVTGDEIVINTKGVPEYTITNHCNLVTTSNYADGLKLKEGDRRACVIQFGSRANILLQDFFNDYYPWVKSGGAEAVYEYLLNVDMAGFEPKGRAPWTEAKSEVTEATRAPMEKWVRDLWEDPDSVLPPILQGAEVLTPEQLGAAYYPNDPGKNTPGLRNAIGLRMKEMGFARTELIKVDGKPVRVWIIRDREGDWNNDRIRKAVKKGKF